ncbi:MAG: exodeoxyribonuclease VII small subunit [Holosporales bacterium]|jgi:exodeoxyribonuclease VII small subunit|nr:exodeoxyribonuclease VII small subunit [Holosporales bacterium]
MQLITDEEILNLSFEEALGRLEAVVKALEQGDLPLDDAVVAFELGNKLKRRCEGKLQEAKLKIEKVVRSAQGEASTVEVKPS